MSTHHILGLKKVPRVRLFADESGIEVNVPTKEEKDDTDMRTGRKQAEAYYCALATNIVKQI